MLGTLILSSIMLSAAYADNINENVEKALTPEELLQREILRCEDDYSENTDIQKEKQKACIKHAKKLYGG